MSLSCKHYFCHITHFADIVQVMYHILLWRLWNCNCKAGLQWVLRTSKSKIRWYRLKEHKSFSILLHLFLQASLVIRDLTLRVFAITRFREKKPWENCTVILQSPCTVVAWLCGARTSWSHLTSISVRGSVELVSPVDVERSSLIFKAMKKKK